MSNLVVSNLGELNILLAWKTLIANASILSLFRNNYTPVDTSVYTDFTKANFTGYADQVIAWTNPVTIAGKATITDNAVRSFVMGNPPFTNTIYGYYVWNNAGGAGFELLLWAERFDSVVNLVNVSDEIDLTARLTMDSEFH